MARPRKCRHVRLNPAVRFYKPQGVPLRQLRVVALKDEELEALSLADFKGLDHEAAAALMNISRSTFSRILAQARRSVATALVEGAALKIGGGDFQIVSEDGPVETTSKDTKGTDDASNG
jgi:predicted DNA-binding protein (UPF0251 family)